MYFFFFLPLLKIEQKSRRKKRVNKCNLVGFNTGVMSQYGEFCRNYLIHGLSSKCTKYIVSFDRSKHSSNSNKCNKFQVKKKQQT